ncbi:glycosyltransferase [Micromonospora sp. PLK6-60]|uniref:glycosyltransferase family 2 protein n=1 Tax=Micromonospora sp. PLK6-60 TaxID=2873383 RepID=UPI001CA747CB|nr:glycosyltransferase [Micromonospora sp. PLK6-60]MBY8870657.1 glycosyltransferase [Micromonospora sp. PLK6-60]
MGLVTVVIPTRNRPRDLRQCLLALRENDLRHLDEVIVVDDASRPVVSEEVELANLPVRVLRNHTSLGAMASRNRAAEEAAAPILGFLDDDALPRQDWLSRIVEGLAEDRGAVTGRVLPFDQGVVSRARQARYLQRYRSLTEGQPVTFFAGGNSAVWRDLFVKAGGFSALGVGGDNSVVDGLQRLDRPVCFLPELVVVHRNGKGLLRAFLNAYHAGRDHPRPLSAGTALRDVLRARPVPADPASQALNWALQVTHTMARGLAAPRPADRRIEV